jgi:acyl-ACP thioesterase
VAIEDVDETGWGLPEHLWFVRRIRVDVLTPPLEDREVGLVTWCSGLGAVAAGRRWSLTGERGGRIEVDSVWIHLGPDPREPLSARLDYREPLDLGDRLELAAAGDAERLDVAFVVEGSPKAVATVVALAAATGSG